MGQNTATAIAIAALVASCGGGDDADDGSHGTASVCATSRPVCTTQSAGQNCRQLCTPYWPTSCTTVCQPVAATTSCTAGGYVACSTAGATTTGTAGPAPTQVTVSIGAIERIPKFSVATGYSRAVAVQLSPDTLPSGMTVTLRLATLSGAGIARFVDANGNEAETLTLNRSAHVRIKGITHSSVMNNIELSAHVGGSRVAARRFSVRTWPVGYGRTSGCDGVNDGVLHSYYTWHSESGDHADLNGLEMGEFVHFPRALILPDRYCLPNPPYSDDGDVQPCKANPSTWSAPLGPSGRNSPLMIWNQQLHDGPRMDILSGTRAPHTYVAQQYFFFRDPVMMAPQRQEADWSDRKSYQLLNPTAYSITRTVQQTASGAWEFRIEQHSCVETVPL